MLATTEELVFVDKCPLAIIVKTELDNIDLVVRIRKRSYRGWQEYMDTSQRVNYFGVKDEYYKHYSLEHPRWWEIFNE